MMRRIALMLAVAAAGPAWAQPAPLVGGTWVHTEVVPYLGGGDPGQAIRIAQFVQFLPDGSAHSRWMQAGPGGAATSDALYSYQMTGAASYRAMLRDYGPKQDCSNGIACLPSPNPWGQIGSVSECQVAFASQIVMELDCGAGPTRYTRQP